MPDHNRLGSTKNPEHIIDRLTRSSDFTYRLSLPVPFFTASTRFCTCSFS